MPPRRQHHIPELLEIHADELAYLWGQRRAALQDTRYTLASFLELNERVEAHVAGLLTVPSALPGLLGKRLTEATDRDDAFAAAHGLLRLANPALSAKVVELFAAAEGPVLLGLRDALAFAPLGATEPTLQALLAGGDPLRAVAAANVLAQHDHLQPQDAHFTRLLLDDNPAVVEQAWRVLTRLDARLATQPEGAPPRPYKPALLRKEAAVHAAVLGAAVWTAQPWARRGLRLEVEKGDASALGWLAAVGDAADWALMQPALAALPPLQRAPLLARFGHPAALPLLNDGMRSTDATLAAASAEAFTRITGHDVRGARVTPPVREDADEFEREMAPSVWLPDLVQVDAFLKDHGPRLAQGERWNRGQPLAVDAAPGVLANVDLPARWDACARAALAGRPIAAPPPAL